MNPPGWQSLLKTGIEAVQAQDAEKAHKLLEQALRSEPGNRQIRYWLGNAHRLCQRPGRAEALYRSLISESPEKEDAVFALAFLLREQGRPEEATKELLALAGHHVQDPDVLLRIAGFLRDSSQFEAAIGMVQSALAVIPDSADIHFKLSRLFQATGKFPEALKHLRITLDINPDIGGAWLGLAQVQQFSNPASPDAERLEQALTLPLGEESTLCLAFARAKCLDDMQRWPEAWKEYQRGNQLRAKTQPWDGKRWERLVAESLHDSIQQEFSVHTRGRHPVFIVGMLRSGTTLLEQLLDRHPEITGRGELNFLAHLAGRFPSARTLSPNQRQELASDLWTHMRLDGPEQHHYIDKNPLNFRFLGWLLRIMPEARIIHVTRDGRDSCLSCFFQLFQHPDAGFSNTLVALERYYRGYRKIMRHWQHLAGERIHTVSYERLVRATDGELGSVLGFLGLEQNKLADAEEDALRPVRTASSWQVRQEVHQRSLGRWEHYYPMAPGFFDALARIDVEYANS